MAQLTVVPVRGGEAEHRVAEMKVLRPALLPEPAHHAATHWSIYAEECRLLAFIPVRQQVKANVKLKVNFK